MQSPATGVVLNAFTAPRGPAFTEAERRAMRYAEAGRRNGARGYAANGGQIYTTINPRPRPRQQ